MTSLLSLPVELLTQIALETSDSVSERDYFMTKWIDELPHYNKNITSLVLVCKRLYLVLRHLRFQAVQVQLHHDYLEADEIEAYKQRIDYIHAEIPAGTVKAFFVQGSGRGGDIYRECSLLFRKLLVSPALQGIGTLGIANMQHHVHLLRWIPQSRVELLLVNEIQGANYDSVEAFSPALCKYLASFQSLKSSHVTYSGSGDLRNALVLQDLELKALRVYFGAVPMPSIPAILGLRMLEIEYIDVELFVGHLNRHHCILEGLQILSIFEEYNNSQTEEGYSGSVSGLIALCPNLQELDCWNLNDGCVLNIVRALPASLTLLSGNMYSLYALLELTACLALLAKRWKSSSPPRLRFSIHAQYFDSELNEYLDLDGCCYWLPSNPMTSFHLHDPPSKHEALRREAREAVKRAIGNTLRHTLDYHNIPYDTSNWSECLRHDVLGSDQRKM